MGLRELRENSGLTLAQVDVDPGLLSRVERGERDMTMTVARTLAKTYRVSLDKIVAEFDAGLK